MEATAQPGRLAAICSGCWPHPGLTQPWTVPEKAGAASLPRGAFWLGHGEQVIQSINKHLRRRAQADLWCLLQL